jgi:predicted RNA polymerase sigma factor
VLLLAEIKPFPSVKLNLVVVLIQGNEIKNAEKIYNDLRPNQFLPNPYLYYAVGGLLFQKINNIIDAEKYLITALQYAGHPSEKETLQRRLNNLRN